MATIILSTNNNPDYSFYLPITCFVWEKFGFTPLSIIVGQSNVYSLIDEEIKLRARTTSFNSLPNMSNLSIRSDSNKFDVKRNYKGR